MHNFCAQSTTNHDWQNVSFLLLFHIHRHTGRVSYVRFLNIHTQSFANQRNSNNKPFLTISLLCFNTISACISKKKTQFSKLYLCNCPEKMGKMGFVLSVFLLFVFGQAKNLQGIPLCKLKYGEGTTYTVPEDSTEWI